LPAVSGSRLASLDHTVDPINLFRITKLHTFPVSLLYATGAAPRIESRTPLDPSAETPQRRRVEPHLVIVQRQFSLP
jgi:hypothetical protein